MQCTLAAVYVGLRRGGEKKSASLHLTANQQHVLTGTRVSGFSKTQAGGAPFRMQDSWLSVCCRHVCTVEGIEV